MTPAVLTTMSQEEIDRAEWMLRIRERRTTQARVAEYLGVTVRQVERMYRAYKAGGAAALVSKKRGRPSARRIRRHTAARCAGGRRTSARPSRVGAGKNPDGRVEGRDREATKPRRRAS